MRTRHLLAAGLLSLSLPLLAEESPTIEPTSTPTAATEAPADTSEAPPATAEPAAERVSPPEISVAQAKALSNQLTAEEQQQLQAGAESFLALWLPANSAEPEGLIILLPGDGESADWPQVIAPLRRKLPDAGWSTLSLTLPDPQAATIPPRPAEPATSPETATPPTEEGAQPAADTESATAQAQPADTSLPPASHEQRVLARLDAALEAARLQQPKRLILLGHGTGAYWAARYIAEKKPSDIANLLLVAAAAPQDSDESLTKAIVDLKLATGDFYYKDQAPDRQAALHRMQAGKRQEHPAYVQIGMKALPGNPDIESEQLFRRIRGWLSLQLQSTPGKP